MAFWFGSDWINPFRPSDYNWIDFSLIHASGEYDRRFGNIEFHIALLGFHVWGQWNVAGGDAELKASLDKMISDWSDGTARVTMTVAEYDELKGGKEKAP